MNTTLKNDGAIQQNYIGYSLLPQFPRVRLCRIHLAGKIVDASRGGVALIGEASLSPNSAFLRQHSDKPVLTTAGTASLPTGRATGPWEHPSLIGPRARWKRWLDILASLIVGIALVPVFLIGCFLVYLESPGPVIFSQIRVGVRGRRFRCYKIRSMHLRADELWDEFRKHNEMSGPIFKMQNDPRVLKIGSYLRKYSVDEIPQLWNVLRGDMSMVGPRPPLPAEVAEYEPHHRRRLDVKPGLSGLWQVSGRSKIVDFEDVVTLDLEYIQRWSIGLDVWILAKTVWVVAGGRGSC